MSLTDAPVSLVARALRGRRRKLLLKEHARNQTVSNPPVGSASPNLARSSLAVHRYGRRPAGIIDSQGKPRSCRRSVASIDAGEAVEIGVLDNSTGIPADIKDKVFQPFFTTKPTGEGTGLGLSITYDIVTPQHGGSIAADSEEGEYSEFTVRLPRDP